MFWFFGHETCGILAPRPGIKPVSPELAGEPSTTGPPGKSPHCFTVPFILVLMLLAWHIWSGLGVKEYEFLNSLFLYIFL